MSIPYPVDPAVLRMIGGQMDPPNPGVPLVTFERYAQRVHELHYRPALFPGEDVFPSGDRAATAAASWRACRDPLCQAAREVAGLRP